MWDPKLLNQGPFRVPDIQKKRRTKMKKFKLSFWLALATASMFAIQLAAPASHSSRFDDPMPTCPPECPTKPKPPAR
jgi:hypothetical protein